MKDQTPDEPSHAQRMLTKYNALKRTDDVLEKVYVEYGLMKSGAKVLKRYCRHTTWEAGQWVNYPIIHNQNA